MNWKNLGKILKNTPVDIIIGNNSCRRNNSHLIENGIRVCTLHGARSVGYMELVFSGDPASPICDLGLLNKATKERETVEKEYKDIARRYGTDDVNELKRLASGTGDAVKFIQYKRRLSDLDAKIAIERLKLEGNTFVNRFIEYPGFVCDESGEIGKLRRRYLDSLRSSPDSLSHDIQSFLSEHRADSIFVVSPKECIRCHKAQYDHWSNTAHASSFAPVSRIGSNYDPQCVRCHTTGYHVKKGFDIPPPPPDFQGVNCEACHGFLGDHLSDFLTSPPGRLKSEDPMRIIKLCRSCHEKDRDPDFKDIFHDSFERIKCPPIDYSRPEILSLYREREKSFNLLLSEKGRLENADQYVRLSIYMKRLGRPYGDIIDILYQGFRINHNNVDLVRMLYKLLLDQKRPKEALDVMETYLADNPKDKEINLEVMRLLTLARRSEVRNPERARDYIAWYFENMSRNDIELYLLLATADLQLGGKKYLIEAMDALNVAESLKPSPMDKEKIKILRKRIKDSL